MTALQALDASPTPRAACDRTLPALLLRSREPVVVESYFAGWEKPWRALSSAAWRELFLALDGGLHALLVETGANREFAERHGLEVIPTVLVFLRGELVARFTGRVSPQQVAAAVRGALAQLHQRDAEEAELALLADASESSSPVRSILRRRSSTPALAHAG